MTTVTESSGDGSNSSSVLECLKAMDLIDQLEIADGLKQLLLSRDSQQCNKTVDGNKNPY